MEKVDVLIELEGDQFPNPARAEQVVNLPVEGGITKHKAERKRAASLLDSIPDGEAIVEVGGQRLFAEDVFSGLESGYSMFAMEAIPRTHRHPVKSRIAHHVLIPVIDPKVLAISFPRCRDGVRVRISDSRNSDAFFIGEQSAQARAAADNSKRRFGCHGVKGIFKNAKFFWVVM